MSGEYHPEGDFISNLLHVLKYDELKLNLNDKIFNHLTHEYRGEGNENLVLYLPEIKFVLRLRKNHANDNIDLPLEREKLRISLLYYNAIIHPFLSNKYCTIPIIAEISNTIIKELDEKLFPKRPGNRKDKRILFNGIEIHPDYTFLLSFTQYQRLNKLPVLDQAPETETLKKILSHDYLNFRNYVYTLLTNRSFVDRCSNLGQDFQSPTFSVEIKPKQAWTAEAYRRFDLCAFCMNQYFKLNENKINSKSQYCPLDLFSGIECRMKAALKGLLETPQNNLKIFKNGKMIFGEKFPNDVDSVLSDWFYKSSTEKNNEWYKEHFSKLMIEVLLKDFSQNEKLPSFKVEHFSSSKKYKICSDEDTESIKKAINESELKCKYNYSNLPENCILNRIMELQRLDEAGLEAAFDFYENKIKKYANEYSYLDDLISRVKFLPDGIKLPILNIAEAYTLSTAAKDLSLMIAFRSIPRDANNSEFIVDVDGSRYEVNVSVVDIGPKPISCIKKHWKRDKMILAACLNYFC